jgi:hypothetical protein
VLVLLCIVHSTAVISVTLVCFLMQKALIVVTMNP